MKSWLRISLLGATVASVFSACGGQDEGNPANVSGASSTGGRSSGGVTSTAPSGGSVTRTYGGATSSGGASNSGGVAGMGTTSAGGRATVPSGGASDGGVGGAPMEPPDKEPEVECPAMAPAEMATCEGRGHCSYVGVRCECMGGVAGGQWKCDGSGAACPTTHPAAKSACENPKDGPALKCPYPDDSTCNCKGGVWACTEPAKPGEPKPGEPKPGEPKPGEPKPGEPKPGEPGPGAGGAPPGPPPPDAGGEGGAPPKR